MAYKIGKKESTHLQLRLYAWHETLERHLPWKESRDPYRTWVSEIILQQTRVAQGTPYYLRFIEAFPTVTDLADADIDKVLLLWQGLGYYSRARNMHSAATYIRDNLNGIFPSTYDALLELKGVGEYTAAAIASFSYDLPHAVVDGNVKRVIARLYGIDTPINSGQGHKEIVAANSAIFDESQAAKYNQAIMDLGATVCLPKAPHCEECPWMESCIAYADQVTDLLPTKKKSKPKRHRYFAYHWYDYKGKVAIRQRGTQGLWKGLYELPFDECATAEDLETIKSQISESENILAQGIKHVLSHQIIHAIVIRKSVTVQPSDNDFIWVEKNELSSYSMPRILTRVIEGVEEFI